MIALGQLFPRDIRRDKKFPRTCNVQGIFSNLSGEIDYSPLVYLQN